MWDGLGNVSEFGSAIIDSASRALAESFFITLSIAGIAWIVIYVGFGCWLRWHIAGRYSASAHRITPVIVSHTVYSVLFINPYSLLYWTEVTGSNESMWIEAMLTITYLGLIPLVLDGLLTRLLPRWHNLRWLRWDAPLRPDLASLIIALLLSAAAFFAAVQAYMYWESL